jgi:hypothetical protein
LKRIGELEIGHQKVVHFGLGIANGKKTNGRRCPSAQNLLRDSGAYGLGKRNPCAFQPMLMC